MTSSPTVDRDPSTVAVPPGLKFEPVVLRNTRRIRFLFSSAYHYRDLFTQVVERLAPG